MSRVEVRIVLRESQYFKIRELFTFRKRIIL